MADYEKMTVDEFDLLIRSMHRMWTQDPSCITQVGDSTFYKDKVSVFMCSHDKMWPSVDNVKYECSRPNGLFNSKQKKKYDEAIDFLKEIRREKQPGSIEERICKHVPCASDIIAEKALVEDGN